MAASENVMPPCRRRPPGARTRHHPSYADGNSPSDGADRSVLTVTVTARPLAIFDGDCAFRASSVDFIRARIRPGVDFAPWQQLDLTALGLTEYQAERAVQWIDGAELMLIPPINWLAAGLYRLVADNRHRLPGGPPACALPTPKHRRTTPRPVGDHTARQV